MVDWANGVTSPGGGSFVPPNLGLDTKIPALVDAYWSGLEEAYKRRNQDAFKDGIPKGADGNPDYNAILSKTLTAGGTPQTGAAVSLAGVDLSRRLLDLGQQQTNLIARTEGLGGNPAPMSGQPAVAPVANAGARSTAPAPGVQPGQPAPTGGAANGFQGYSGGDNGKNTITSIVSSRMPPELAGPAINGISAMMGTDPNKPIDVTDPVVRARLVEAMRKYQGGDGGAAPAAGPQPAPQPAPQMAQAAPAPGQPPASPGSAAPPAAAFSDRFPTAQGRGSPPTGPDPEIQKKIAVYTALAASPVPQVAAAAKARLADLQKSIDPPDDVKKYEFARRQGYQGTYQEFAAAQKADETYAAESTKSNIKKYEGINTAGERSRQEVPQLQLARKLTEDPNFYSGTGEKYNLVYKRLLSAFGADPNVAAPQEAFRKIVSNSILDSIKSLAGTGQIRVAEINIMREAAASTENTPAANKVLIEIATRLNQRAIDVSDMAQGYHGGRLDAGFDRQVSAYDRAHPLFKPEEISNFRNIIKSGSATASGSTPSLEGRTATNPTTKQQMINRNGKWVPLT